ncbi:MAG: helicase-exonuclease AddAB subunit AddA [Ruminococcaceae bacterium]|nr:helicase-exonuclease AddAB subunit AddA [Oscillospiraceae bacterium]
MSEKKWTNEQLSAIYTSNSSDDKKCNLLISAAAGSGKTAVLVERIIKKVLPDDDDIGTDINSLLVVTFTNAAAQEMKERVNKALTKELKQARLSGDEDKIKHIKRQILYLTTADITTIDAFCMKIVRENFSILDIDPGFSIADEGQCEILMDETIEELFSLMYSEKNDEFFRLMDLYGSASGHKQLSALIKDMYKYTRSIPFPMKWLKDVTDNLKYDVTPFKNSPLYKRYQEITRSKLESIFNSTKAALKIICTSDDIEGFILENPPEKGIEVYDTWGNAYKAFYFDYKLIKELISCDDLSKVIHGCSFSQLSFGKNAPEEPRNKLRYIRDHVKTTIKDIASEYTISLEEAEKVSSERIYPVAFSLYHIISQFDFMYMEKKKNRSLLDFSDIEHLTLRLFTEHTDIAQTVKERYDEILMDEYQDTSALQEEIFCQIKKEDNLFMVGDMKQSIYRFRSSDPSIFRNKITSFSYEEDSKDRKIILSNNFRSRGEVLWSVNDVFEAVMTEEAGELNYDDSQKLHQIKESYDNMNQNHTSECIEIAVETSEEDEDNPEKYEMEARFIASEIIRLKNEYFKVFDGNEYRDVENKDFAILLSKYKNVAEIYANVLNDAGIECYAESSSYFDQSEIRLMISLLETITNPHCDIPLIGVLRSPIASFTDDEVVIIRKTKKGKFFTALKELIALNKSGKLTESDSIKTAEKAEAFYQNLNRWRRYSRYMSTDKLIWTLYEETDFYAFCGAMYDGETIQANLRLLFLRAKQYEDSGFRGLFNFIKYLQNLKQRDTNLTSAKLVANSHNSVQIMSIHKSKGLEMPVVFVAGGGTTFNTRSQQVKVRMHKDYGLGFDIISYEHRYKLPTFEKKMIKRISESEQISEEIRKLYVAMTRAREKLYFVSSHSYDEIKGSASELGKRLQRWEESINGSTVSMTPYDVLSSKCFADWVCPVAMCSDNWSYRLIYSSRLTKECNTEKAAVATESNLDVDSILSYTYPHRESTTLPSKVTVSKLKSNGETTLVQLPKFLHDKTESGAFYGTAMHSFMQNICLSKNMSLEYIKDQIAYMEDSGIISQKEAKKLSPEKIHEFFSSPLGVRLLSAKNVYREQNFEVSLPANIIYPNVPNIENENVILQGVIDCYFEEDDGLVLIDYKTDRFNNREEIKEKYSIQLNLYSLALQKITKKNVKNAFFYLFFDNSVL